MIGEGQLTTLKLCSDDQEVVVREVITELMCNERIMWGELVNGLGFLPAKSDKSGQQT
jgi:hypothetical protein